MIPFRPVLTLKGMYRKWNGGSSGGLGTGGVASRSLCSHISLSVRLADLALRLVQLQVSAGVVFFNKMDS